MSDILEFPTLTRHREKLRKAAAGLEEIYENLDRAYGLIYRLEEEAKRQERGYNKSLIAYADLMGGENVEIEFLQYATNLAFDLKTGQGGIIDEEEEEES